MEFENIFEEQKKIKRKPKLKIKSLIISFLVVSGIILGIYFYFKCSNPKDIYLKVIDSLNENVNLVLDETATSLLHPKGVDFELGMNLKHNDPEMQEAVKILNKMKFKMSVEADLSKKKMNNSYDILYDNDSLLYMDLIVSDNTMYAKLGNLYDKTIKIFGEEVEQIWESSNIENYKTIVNELTIILKENLKEEYFVASNEKIEINGKNIFSNKYVLNIEAKELEILRNLIIEDIENNDKLIEALTETSGLTKGEIIDALDSEKDVAIDDDESLYFEIYVNRLTKKIERFVDATMAFDRINDNEYKIKDLENNTNLGELNMNKEEFILNIKDEEAELNITMSIDKLKIMFEYDGDILEINFDYNEASANGYLKYVSDDDGMEIQLDIALQDKEIDDVSDKIINDYIEVDSMTEEDFNNIILNLYQNKAFINLFTDLTSTDLSNSLLGDAVTY